MTIASLLILFISSNIIHVKSFPQRPRDNGNVASTKGMMKQAKESDVHRRVAHGMYKKFDENVKPPCGPVPFPELSCEEVTTCVPLLLYDDQYKYGLLHKLIATTCFPLKRTSAIDVQLQPQPNPMPGLPSFYRPTQASILRQLQDTTASTKISYRPGIPTRPAVYSLTTPLMTTTTVKLMTDSTSSTMAPIVGDGGTKPTANTRSSEFHECQDFANCIHPIWN